MMTDLNRSFDLKFSTNELKSFKLNLKAQSAFIKYSFEIKHLVFHLTEELLVSENEINDTHKGNDNGELKKRKCRFRLECSQYQSV
jgi:hypothetical protein